MTLRGGRARVAVACALLCALFGVLLAAAPARAERALLIGVGSYPGLSAALQLQAPEEDARRLADALAGAGMPRDRITLMTARDGQAPTRAAVLAALDTLAAQAAPGEQLLVYFSGHGAQAPTLNRRDEPDGLDELYLMADATGWDGRAARPSGAILDKELAAKLEAIRAKGADVWLVVDACHAGGAFRSGSGRSGAADGVRVKAVPPAAQPFAASPAPARAAAGVPAGRLAAFFAAAPGALAIERRLPLGSPDARPLSQFSYALTRAIGAGRLRSLRDLASAIEAGSIALGGDGPDPAFEGALDLPVLGLAPDRPRRFAFARDTRTIGAGIEEGLATGDAVRLVQGGQQFGTGRIVEAGLGASRIAADGALPPGAIEVERAGLSPGAAPSLMAAVADLGARGAAEGLRVEAVLWRPGAQRACPLLPPEPPADAVPVALDAAPALRQCDVLIATIANRGGAPVDVSPLYVDAGGRLTGLGFVGGGSVRLLPGDTRRIAVRALTQDRAGRALPTGRERLAIAALPVVTRTPRDLRAAAASPWRSGETVSLDAGAGSLVYGWRVVR